MKPTIGRVVLYRPSQFDIDNGMNLMGDSPLHSRDTRCMAHVVYVHSDTCVNLVVFDHQGCLNIRKSVSLADDDVVPSEGMCEWMKYQKDVAAGKLPPAVHAEHPSGSVRNRPQPD